MSPVTTNGRFALVSSAFSLVQVSLLYGIAPKKAANLLFGFDLTAPGMAHIFRAIMGAYWGIASYWVIGAKNESFRNSALLSCALIMYGLAGGRTLSVFLDGLPEPAFLLFIGGEIFSGTLALLALKANYNTTKRE